MSEENGNPNCPSKMFLLSPCTGRSVPAPGMVSLEFAWTGPAPKAGQFFLVKPERTSVFLGRPLSVAAWTPGASGGSGTLRFLLAIRGRGTAECAAVAPGENAFLSGPLGKGWAEVAGRFLARGAPALVSGGAGVAPLSFLARELEGRAFDFYAGFRSGSFGLEGIKPGAFITASEDGSEGRKGRIPDFFSPASYGAVFVCGPEPMLKAVAEKCRAISVPCFISMERRMACGTGACLGCTVKTRNGNRRCCADGPVFRGEDIFYDE